MKKPLLVVGFDRPATNDEVAQIAERAKVVAQELGAELLMLPEGADAAVQSPHDYSEALELGREQNALLKRIAEALEGVAWGPSVIRTAPQQ